MKYNKNHKINNILTLTIAIFFCFLFQNCKKQEQSTDTYILKEIQKDLNPDVPEENKLISDIDSLLKEEKPNILKTINQYGKHLHFTGQQAKAILFYESIISDYQSQKNLTTEDYANLIMCHIPLGAAFEELGLKNTAMNIYSQGISTAREHNLQEHQAMLLNNIGVIYYGIEDYNQALHYFTEASIINARYNNKQELFINYNNIAEIHLKNNALNESMDYSLKALQFLDEAQDQEMYYMMHANIGQLYNLRNELPMAISYLNNAITHQKKLGLTTYLITSYLTIADVYKKLNSLDSAHYFAAQAFSLSQETQNISLQTQALQLQSKLAKSKKEYEKSLTLLEQANILQDSIIQLDNQKKMKDWEKIYELEREEASNKTIISEISPKFILATLLLVAIITVSTTTIVNLKDKNKNKSLKIKEQTKQISLEKEKNQEIQKNIDHYNRQLTTQALEKIRLNEHITDINNELKQVLLEINPRSKEHKERIQNLLNKLLLLETNSHWEEFQYYFEQVHPQFYEKLEGLYPTLTAKEKRLCAFISLGLSTKEIAEITFREVRSCESARNRLRKKLGVDPEIDLTNFIRQITH